MSKTLKPLHRLHPDARPALRLVRLRLAVRQLPRDARANDEIAVPAGREAEAVAGQFTVVLGVARQGVVVDLGQAVIHESRGAEVAAEDLESRRDVAQLAAHDDAIV